MANVTQTLATLMEADGAIGAAIVDSNSGMVLGKLGTGLNLDVAAAGNTEVVRAKMKTMKALGLRDAIEDILITLGTQYHVLRPIADKAGLFIYIALDKNKSNLAMARHKVVEAEKGLTV
jgi:predicted regulator of Ras-like GTPase activity (Roadblock/LC7/MglB family)